MNARSRFPVWVFGLTFLALAALACDAEETPPPLIGITCLEQQDDGSIVALEQYNSYVSITGGLTWQKNGPLQPDPVKGCAGYYSTRYSWTLADPAHPGVIYRFNPETSIERSGDGGATWQQEVDLSGTEARTTYYVSSRKDGADFRSGPVDAIFDTRTGDLVVAMSYEGVLVRTPEPHWWWVTVGKYSRVDMRDMSITLPLISNELWLAALIGLVVAGTLPTLARGVNFWLLASAGIVSGVSVIGLLFILLWMSATLNSSVRDPVLLVIGGAIALVVPLLISWKISAVTQQKDRLAFMWSGFCWTYLGMELVVLASRLSGHY